MHEILSHPLFAIGLPHGTDWLYIFIYCVLSPAIWLWALISCIKYEADTGNTKIVWVLVIAIVPCMGALLYLIIRRPQRIKELGR